MKEKTLSELVAPKVVKQPRKVVLYLDEAPGMSFDCAFASALTVGPSPAGAVRWKIELDLDMRVAIVGKMP